MLDLAASRSVRRRFRFTDDDLERLQEWVVESGVRWGLDAPHRARFGLQRIAQNTWRAGLDRILLGAAMAEDDLRWIDTALAARRRGQHRHRPRRPARGAARPAGRMRICLPPLPCGAAVARRRSDLSEAVEGLAGASGPLRRLTVECVLVQSATLRRSI